MGTLGKLKVCGLTIIDFLPLFNKLNVPILLFVFKFTPIDFLGRFKKLF